MPFKNLVLIFGVWILFLNLVVFHAQAQCLFVDMENYIPVDGEIVSSTPTLQLTEGFVPDAPICSHDYTEWQIATDPDFEFIVFDSGDDGLNLLSLVVPSGYLEPGTTYYWRARPKSIFGDVGFWTEYTRFSVGFGSTEAEPVEDFAPGRPREVRQASIVLPGETEPKLITFEVVDGLAIFEGDIILGEFNQLPFQSARQPLQVWHPEGIGIKPLGDIRWPNGVVPYTINTTLDQEMRNRISTAIRHWENNTAIRFINHTTETDYVEFTSGGGCASFVGRIGGKQTIVLAKGCSTGSVIHEIGHAVGLFHEQSRCDRDQHVTILWQNITSGRENNFENQCKWGSDLGAYDFGSIMHYPAFAFSKNNLPTIQTIPQGMSIGNRTGLSAGDIASVDALYGQVSPAPPPVGNNNPTVTLTYTPLNPTPADIINFVTNALDPDGDALAYEWFINGFKQPATQAQTQWSNPDLGFYTVVVRVSDSRGGVAEDSVSFNVTVGDTPTTMTIERAIDQNGNGFIDDDEIVRAIQFWIMSQEVPRTGQTISDDKIQTLIQLWILGIPIP